MDSVASEPGSTRTGIPATAASGTMAATDSLSVGGRTGNLMLRLSVRSDVNDMTFDGVDQEAAESKIKELFMLDHCPGEALYISVSPPSLRCFLRETST
jgi:hypothetical protein